MNSRILKGMASVALSAALVACGNQIPKGWSQEAYDIACDALDVAERFNDGKLSAESAERTMNQLLNKLDLETMEDETQLTILELEMHDFVWNLIADFGTSTTMDNEDSLRAMINRKY